MDTFDPAQPLCYATAGEWEANALAVLSGPVSGMASRQRTQDMAFARWQKAFHMGLKHGEIEVFNSLGWHLGALDARTGRMVKEARKGRRLYVR